MIKFTKNRIDITLDDGLTRSEEVEELIDEVQKYQICHPMRVFKLDGRLYFSRILVSELEEYKKTIEPIEVPVGDLTAVLYPVFGCRKEDITEEDIDEFIEYILDPIFIGKDENGELYVSP